MNFSQGAKMYQKFPWIGTLGAVCIMLIFLSCNQKNTFNSIEVSQVLKRIGEHNFNPMNEEYSLTIDHEYREAGIPDLDDNDWQVRLLGVRDLVRAGAGSIDEILVGLTHNNENVRHVSAMALGVINSEKGIKGLEQLALDDEAAVVRSQAIISLGQIGSPRSLDLIRKILKEDTSRDVIHQCELAIDQIEKHMGSGKELLDAFLSLDEKTFNLVQVGEIATDFELEDTEGIPWKLGDYKNREWVVLIWVFADWCPVCHGEFHDLMDMQEEFEEEGIEIVTIEIHDMYRGRVMVGKELEPTYWFSKKSLKEVYTSRIEWPHLLDRAGAVGAMYGMDPLAFAVHAEYINRPGIVIIDQKGIVRFLYKGTFWGDRPSIEQTLDMIRTQDFSFEHPNRRK